MARQKTNSKKPQQKKSKVGKMDMEERGIFLNPEYHNLIIIFLGFFLVYALMSSSEGFLPKMMQNLFKGLFGGLSYFIPFILIIFGILGFIDGSEMVRRIRRTKIYYLVIFFIFVIYGLINYGSMPTQSPLKSSIIQDIMKMGVTGEGVGLIPSIITYYLTAVFGVFGSWLLMVFLLILSGLYIFDFSINDFVNKIKGDKYEKAGEDAGMHTRFNIFKKNAENLISEEVDSDTNMNTSFFERLKNLVSKPKYDDYGTLIAETDRPEQSDKTIKIDRFEDGGDGYVDIIEIDDGYLDQDETGGLDLLDRLKNSNNDPSAESVKRAQDDFIIENYMDEDSSNLDGGNDIGNDTGLDSENLGLSGDTNNFVQTKRPTNFSNLEKADDVLNENPEREDISLQNFDGVEISRPDLKPKKIKKTKKYVKPTIDLLNSIKTSGDDNARRKIRENADKLKQTLNDFGVDAKILQATVGPTITRYEIQPSPGVKVSKILSLTDDIALTLAAKSIRIEAPIPGKNAIGIEIPNEKPSMVGIKEVLASKEFRDHKSPLAFGLGKDVAGNIMVADIAKMPHLLIAGSTGSGKSVCVNTLITSILYKASPEEVKLILIDPKVVELANYNGIPHMLSPVVTNPKLAANALNQAVGEMERRYKLFAEAQVKDISSYNSKVSKDERLPKIVIIIDELADLMMVSSNDVEASICRLAQMARAAGMHLIVATQRPSVDVITGLIKANIPSRISFAVSSQTDSRTIIDMGGAEKLLGKGDMLYFPMDVAKPSRIQGAFISEDESDRVIEFVKEQNHDVEIEDKQNQMMEKIKAQSLNPVSGDQDEFLNDAIKFVVENDQGDRKSVV